LKDSRWEVSPLDDSWFRVNMTNIRGPAIETKRPIGEKSSVDWLMGNWEWEL